MSAVCNGQVRYRNVIGSSLSDRSAFDGSVPYSISCSGNFSCDNNGDSAATCFGLFCFIGSPGTYNVSNGVFPAETKTGLAKQCSIKLRDFWLRIDSPLNDKNINVGIAVYDPTGEFPSGTVEHTHLYECFYEGGYLKLPDISGLVISPGLNIGVTFGTNVAAHTSNRVIFHCVADIDD